MTSRGEPGNWRPDRDTPRAGYFEVIVTKVPDVEPARLAAARDAQEIRLADLLRRIRDGSYDNRGVMEQVARRILERGDL